MNPKTVVRLVAVKSMTEPIWPLVPPQLQTQTPPGCVLSPACRLYTDAERFKSRFLEEGKSTFWLLCWQRRLLGAQAPTRQSDVGETAPTRQSDVGETAPTRQSDVGETAPTRQSDVGETAPTRQSDVGETAPTRQSDVGETAPTRQSDAGETASSHHLPCWCGGNAGSLANHKPTWHLCSRNSAEKKCGK